MLTKALIYLINNTVKEVILWTIITILRFSPVLLNNTHLVFHTHLVC